VSTTRAPVIAHGLAPQGEDSRVIAAAAAHAAAAAAQVAAIAAAATRAAGSLQILFIGQSARIPGSASIT